MKLKYLSTLITLLTMNTYGQSTRNDLQFAWSQATKLPSKEGFAGAYVGVSNNVLIFAGGSNFPGNKRPWENANKMWYDKIYVLKSKQGSWKAAGKLPHSMGYGVALTYKNSVICVGGGDSKQCFDDVFRITWEHGKIMLSHLPSLPAPMMNACGVISGSVVYIMGGITSPSGESQNNFWSLNLAEQPGKLQWKVLDRLPEKSRMLATSGAIGGSIFLFGGVHLFPSGNSLEREYLKDCHEYAPGHGWIKISDLPYPLAATPSPALPEAGSHLLLFGGDDGALASKVFELKDIHPGFTNKILEFNVKSGLWTVGGEIPVEKRKDSAVHPHNSIYAPVTTPLVIWNHIIILAGGEARPGVRSNRVLTGSYSNSSIN
jgi:N-acetylneuraminic acid mutarotase